MACRLYAPHRITARPSTSPAVVRRIRVAWLPHYYSPFRQQDYADQLEGAKPGIEIYAPVTFTVADDVVSIDTGVVFEGPPIGTNTTGQEAEGPHCIDSAGGGEH